MVRAIESDLLTYANDSRIIFQCCDIDATEK